MPIFTHYSERKLFEKVLTEIKKLFPEASE